MTGNNLRVIGWSAWLLAGFAIVNASAAERLPIESFTRFPTMKSPVLSPDGRYLAVISSVNGRQVALVRDLKTNGEFAPAMSSDAEGSASLEWCTWATASRLLCGFRGVAVFRTRHYPNSKAALADADGKNLKETSTSGSFPVTIYDASSIQRIAGDPARMMLRMYLPAVVPANTQFPFPNLIMRLDTASGEWKRESEFARLVQGNNLGDGKRAMNLAKGTRAGFEISSDGKDWVLLKNASDFSKNNPLWVRGVTASTGRAYAYALNQGRVALWEFDLDDKAPPVLGFSHPKVDVGEIATDGIGVMIGVHYDTDRPRVQYIDANLVAIMRGIDQKLTDSYNYIQSISDDRTTLVIASQSDVEAGRYYLYNTTERKITDLGSMYPALDRNRLARMKSIDYSARDGVKIPAYLTTPDQPAEKLPLIVLPHSGYQGRSRWEFDSLTQFLASRGYAVMSMNYRGSAGYGVEWVKQGNRDWSGVVYDDVIDATKWAVAQGVADPQRICILGQGYSGHTALSAASRNPDLFKCAISIGGRTDTADYANYIAALADGYAGTETEVGKRAKEPVLTRTAEQVKIPVLLIHGTDDTRAPFSESKDMAKALDSEGKKYKFVEIERADHSFWRESERKTVLTEIEAFLSAELASR